MQPFLSYSELHNMVIKNTTITYCGMINRNNNRNDHFLQYDLHFHWKKNLNDDDVTFFGVFTRA